MKRVTKTPMSEDQLQVLYREWGVFYSRKQKLDIATNFYEMSLKLKDDPKAFYNRSRCRRYNARTEEAFHDATAALESNPLSQPYNLEVCDGMYQLNQLETARCEAFNSSMKFEGLKLNAFHNLTDVLDDNFNASLGDTLGSFILEHEKYFYRAWEELNQEVNVDKRPLWKKLKEQGKCDVVSVIEKEEELISPREMARRQHLLNVVNQCYFRSNWIDVLFLKQLKSNPSLLLEQCLWSTPLLAELTQRKYDATIRFLKMLHARCPLYTQKVRKCPNRKLADQTRQNYLFRLQYQIHRNMLRILREMRQLRTNKQIDTLSKFVEEIMGDYIVLKTRRVMAWKFEFISEVYNILALARLDQYIDSPKNVEDYHQKDRLNVLLKMPREKDKEPAAFVFGDRSTYSDPDADDVSIMKHKKLMIRMEKRIIFSKYPIEKSYLLHEIATSHLKNARFDESCLVARKSIEEARKCNSLVWMMLGLLLICKTNSFLRKIEQINIILTEAAKIATRLKNPKLKHFIDLLQTVNEGQFQEKKIGEEMRRMRSVGGFQSKSSLNYSERGSEMVYRNSSY